MDYIIGDRNLILTKKALTNKQFLFYFCKGVINQFSYVLDWPRILVFDEQNLLKKVYKKLTDFGLDIWHCNSSKDFEKMVHCCEFDLGLKIEEIKQNIIVNFVSGSGYTISKTKFSILEKELKKIDFLVKNHEKNAKKHQKIKKISIKYEKNNICSLLQMSKQKEKFFKFGNYLYDDF